MSGDKHQGILHEKPTKKKKNHWDKVMERDKSPCVLQEKRRGRNVLSFPKMQLMSEKKHYQNVTN